ncbi:unnamed protein product [Owenia fusiformis]|uniref:Uncharacterized protein n=1 Tax=Owenia fusiformis TaxID=6347 RepID=A0A8J1TRF2_OWEFU|nr:unnamed protein product [Owenia fusiformis]
MDFNRMFSGHRFMGCFVLIVLFIGSLTLGHLIEKQNLPNEPNPDIDGDISNTVTRGYSKTNSCEVYSINPHLYTEVTDLIMQNQLILYNLKFPQYERTKHTNPLLDNMTFNFQSNRMNRANGKHGITLLNLDFNFPVLSLTLLTIGVIEKHVEIADKPMHCLAGLIEEDKIDTIMALLLRDFNTNATSTTLGERDKICHKVIRNSQHGAYFTYRCCNQDALTSDVICIEDIHIDDIWLFVIYVMLVALKIIVLLFGPLFLPGFVGSLSFDQVPYVVKMKEPLKKKIYVKTKPTQNLKHNEKNMYKFQVNDLNTFQMCHESIEKIPLDMLDVPLDVNIYEYHIDVDHKNLLIESKVPVGLFKSIYRSLCLCKIQNVQPFKDCCSESILGCSNEQGPRSPLWIDVCKLLGRFCIVILVPFPFYIRIVMYYFTEEIELKSRTRTLERLGLHPRYEFNLMEYLTPTHPMLFVIYGFYLIAAFVFVVFSSKKSEGTNTLKNIITTSLRDMKNVCYLEALGFLVRAVIWPFNKYGIFGCCVALLFWPLALPFVIITIAFYCTPIVYLTYRTLVHIKNCIFHPSSDKHWFVRRVEKFRRETTIANISQFSSEIKSTLGEADTCFKKLLDVGGGILLIGSIYAITIMFAECIGMIVEVSVYTLMGIIVNASSVLRYIMMFVMVVMYAQSCFANVYKKYLKLNKALFYDIKKRMRDLDEVTNLPSHLQENIGFKGQELSEQGKHEKPDRIDETETHPHWIINDLILFLDSEDMPRIPIKLFQDVCDIRLAGSPGPVHKSLLSASWKLLSIIVFLLFVFVVIMTFGSIYRVSSTNQTLATLAGGMIPFLFKHKLISADDHCELNTVSFNNKVNEIIDNFYQTWPMNDFKFKIIEEDEGKTEISENVEDCTANGIKLESPESEPDDSDKGDNLVINFHYKTDVIKDLEDHTADGMRQLVTPDECDEFDKANDRLIDDSGKTKIIELKEDHTQNDNVVIVIDISGKERKFWRNMKNDTHKNHEMKPILHALNSSVN